MIRAATFAIIFLFSIQLLTGASSVFSSSAQTTQTPIKHVIIIMVENHSFDNVFGLYPTLNKTNPDQLLSSIQVPIDVLNVSHSIASKPSAIPSGMYSTENPIEDVYQQDWDNGKMDGFALNSGTQSMTYFGPSQFGIEWDWAEQYSIGDRYFSSCLCETDPNRLFSLAGYGAGQTQDFDPPPYIPVNQTIFSELGHYGISWGYYIENPSVDNFPLNYFTDFSTFSSNVQSWSAFSSALTDGSLPSVSWVMPLGGGAEGVDQHPSYNVVTGEDWLLGIVNSVMKSNYWNSSAIFITYDEGGGYYDQVNPPTMDGVQLGFRVPLIVVSPFAKENYVSNTVMNHASTLAFIDYNWQIPALNRYVADTGLPLDMFNFGASPRTPIILNTSSTFPMLPQVPFNQLSYSRDGSTSKTLASISDTLFLQSNNPITPFLQSLPFVAAIAIILFAILVIAIRYGGRRTSRRRSNERTTLS
jgi:phospholipase C